MNQTKVFLLDDHKIIRDGIRSILAKSEEFVVCGESGDPVKFSDDLGKIVMDILVLDLSLPHISGFNLLKKMRMIRPEVKVLILSMHNDPEFMQKALSLGAAGYLAKDCDASELLKFLETVRSGKTITSPAVPVHEVVRKNNVEILSQREQEVLHHLSSGLSSKQIAGELDISTRTVETHRLNIMKKLNTSNSAETIAVAVKLGLL